ncbi:unnamed protein product, partial [Meganyctiphanes norvegica]
VEKLRRLTSDLVQRCGLVKQDATNITGVLKPYSNIVIKGSPEGQGKLSPEMTFLDLIRQRALQKAKEQLGEKVVAQKLEASIRQANERQLQRQRLHQKERNVHRHLRGIRLKPNETIERNHKDRQKKYQRHPHIETLQILHGFIAP